ncbi:helix-turn-helix transcriptional regulator [Nocardia sp. NPDC057440]|uniref:helix-turn-helix transcriptional regulator n=1 Tax=Nocardia sp. NPDC057440 TaxID=3346134 RepID=UPI00366D6379
MAAVGRGARRGFAQRRKALGFTQESLAARVNVERSTVVRWEAGKSEPLAWLWPKLAVALKVTPEQLTDLLAADAMLFDAPAAVPLRLADKAIPDDSSSGSHDGNMFHLRRVLIGCIPDTPPGEPLELTAAVARAWDLFFSARFDEMKRALPAALASAYSAAEAATGETRRQINISLAQLLHASSNLLGYVAQEDLAALALVRADVLATESGDELTRAAIKGSQSWLFAKNGMYDDAAAYADQAAADIEPRLSTATPRHIAIWGELLCYAAFAASRTGDYREARRYLRLCEPAGTQLEDEYASRPEVSNVFGQTSAASFGVINETGANRPREALRLAAVVSGGGTGIPPTLRSRRLINVAQAQIHNRDDAGAVDTLRHACSMAPEFVGHIPLAHALTNELLTRGGRQRPDGLVGVAKRLGVSVQSGGIRP